MPHVPHIITFIEQIAADPEHSDAVVGATCGLIGFVLALIFRKFLNLPMSFIAWTVSLFLDSYSIYC